MLNLLWPIFIIISIIYAVISGNTEKLNNLSLDEHYKYYENQGFYKKEIIKKIAKDRNVNKNEIYMKFI